MADLDKTTYANYTQIASTNITFNWTLDFSAQILSGSATHHLNILVDGVSEVMHHELKSKHEVLGSALHIPLSVGLKSGTSITVTVFYKTTKDCTALQWLSKEQTQGKSFPYLFSQCQPTYARAMAPLQDTPSVKIVGCFPAIFATKLSFLSQTYTATVTSVLPVLLSAIRVSPPSEGPAHDGKIIGKDSVTYSYNQPVPIPSYLIAIASGNVRYKPFPQFEDKEWRTGIWAEPELIEAAYWEFSADTARFLAAEEKFVTPYKFGVYDLLVLPPSFPLRRNGSFFFVYLRRAPNDVPAQENACLSFLTPSLLTGDRTLVDVVVHELTHSWFGNGVTHANATHFWLNEGWTTYIERLLQSHLHSPAARGFSYVIGAKSLTDALKQYSNKPKFQRLVIDYEFGEDPDDAYSEIPYEKGSNLILHLERTLGGLEVFLPYVKDYVSTYIGKSITTEQWKSHLYAYYERNGGPEKIKALDSIDWNAWFYGEGLKLPVEMEYDLTLAEAAYTLAARWDASRSVAETSTLDFQKSDLDSFMSTQIVVFLERLQDYPALPDTHIKHLATVYGVSNSPNAEIRLRFYNLALSPPTSAAAAYFRARGDEVGSGC
ncbi:Leukotriene A-4 hydrolase [Mycena venus]|uniref:Leukotriene A-4 hydrolase n=1 Tax=Mycena venus TaxID=2733690 RepID=A0A8H7CCF0_9AGAR|nr:Leukotriene A-4 hydrolase [Mycena venus]